MTTSWTLATFNTHFGGLSPKGTGRYDAVAANEAVRADVRVLQEVWDHADEPTAFTTPPDHTRLELPIGQMQRPAWPAAMTPTQNARTGWISLVVTTHLPVLDSRVVPLGQVGGDGRTAALLVQVEAPSGPVWIAGVHLARQRIPFGPGGQLQRLRDAMPDGPAVIAGDHNLWRTVAQRVLGPAWHPATRTATWPAHHPVHHIDHVWARGLTVRGRVLPPLGSDHLPVVATLT